MTLDFGSPCELPPLRERGGIFAELADFLEEWNAPTPTITLRTSGSTGEPKAIQADKDAMRASARLSCRVFHLRGNQCALLALPLKYIAGKMMVVRALEAKLRLAVVEPCSHPLADASLPELDFAPLVPLQLAQALDDPAAAARLAAIPQILLGGGFIPPEIEARLQGLPCNAFASYGMTETFSHIALRRVNGAGRSDWYTPLEGMGVSLGPRGTLALSAPHLGIAHLETNDLAELDAGGARFRILGRADAVICSGGLKIHAEDIERALYAATGLAAIAIPRPHRELGECVALLWEGQEADAGRLREACESLPRYHRPHLIQRVDALPRTDAGKPARARCARMLDEAASCKKSVR